jgi:predicted transporter
MDPIRLVSRYALTVYVLSYLVIFAVIHVADLVRPNVEHQYALTGSLPALLFGVAFVVVLVPILRMWDMHGGRWSLEWMMSHLRLRAGGRTSKGSAGGR